ncbi:hypothetical protein G6F31_019830 [Rhizopus arrhizus]|nr:hypothetical protein G6F24_016868 [Rhizopus arrhizus]KAG0922645.1 hypothetical protein G6F31_019830 [Rhizopus arrhizus]
MAPGIGGLGKTMAQQDERAFALGGDMERDAVDGDIARFKVDHLGSSQGSIRCSYNTVTVKVTVIQIHGQ